MARNVGASNEQDKENRSHVLSHGVLKFIGQVLLDRPRRCTPTLARARVSLLGALRETRYFSVCRFNAYSGFQAGYDGQAVVFACGRENALRREDQRRPKLRAEVP